MRIVAIFMFLSISIYAQIQRKSSQNILFNQNVCYYGFHKDFKQAKYNRIWYRNEMNNDLTQGFVINEDSLKIIQSGYSKNDEKFTRTYKFKNRKLKTVILLHKGVSIADSVFKYVHFDYENSDDIYRKDNLILLSHQPEGWCGSANKFRFIQVIDLKNLICYEFFVDVYGCK